MTGKWDKKLQNKDKFMNYHGCELILFSPILRSRYDNNFWVYSQIDYATATFRVHGIIPKVFQIASTKFNFTAEYQPVLRHVNGSFLSDFSYKDTQIITLNGTYREPNICIEAHSLNSYSGSYIAITSPFMQSVEYLLVTPADEYTPYEKLLLPFDQETWVLLLITFSLAFCVIFIINKLSTKVQNVFYGSRVKTPLLNLTSIFFGISQTRLPTGNFSRQILILFVYFCLIFRTCFQSKMFEFMTSHPRHSPPTTIQDLVDRDYTIYTTEKDMIGSYIENDRSFWPRIKQIPYEHYNFIYRTQHYNASAKVALVSDDTFRKHSESLILKPDGWTRLSTDNLIVYHGALAMRKYSFYFKMIAQTVNSLIDTGIMKNLVENHIGTKKSFSNTKNANPQVLTLDDLAFGFNIWLGFCCISIVSFVFEVLILKFMIGYRLLLSRRYANLAKIHPIKLKIFGIGVSSMKLETLEKFRVKQENPPKSAQIENLNEMQSIDKEIDSIKNAIDKGSSNINNKNEDNSKDENGSDTQQQERNLLIPFINKNETPGCLEHQTLCTMN